MFDLLTNSVIVLEDCADLWEEYERGGAGPGSSRNTGLGRAPP